MAPLACRICWACLRSIPVLFISAIIVWSYYAYVVQMCIFTVSHIAEKLLYLFLYHPLMFMLSWCYWKTIFTPVATPSKMFRLSKADYERFDKELSTTARREILVQVGKNLPLQCRTINGEMRFCEKCKALKPDRAHHCSVCGKCVLKMDHHCPWVNNCVCFSNYKFFILFLGYALLYCLYVALSSVQYFIGFWTGISQGNMPMMNLHIVFLFFAAVMFAISLLSLFCYHCYLVSKNRSTLEAFQTPIFTSGPDREGFNLGCYRNFIEVFGRDRRFWFLPVYTSIDNHGDGLVYPSRSGNSVPMVSVSQQSLPAAVTIAPQTVVPSSQGDGLTYPIRTVDEDYDSLLGQRQRWTEEADNEDGSADYFIKDETRNSSRRS